MADINVERKSPGIWPWIIGLIVLALLIWALAAAMGGDDEADVAMDPVATEVDPVAPVVATVPETDGAAIPVSMILANPAEWSGRTVDGEVQVVEVPTDRGFWIESQGERLFVILDDRPSDAWIDINPGQTIRMSTATVRTGTTDVPGDIDPDTRNIVQGIPAFLTVDEENVEILQRNM